MTPGRLGTISLGGVATFSGLVALEHVLRPDYDPRRRYVSEYAVGRYHEVMTAAFFALAGGSAALLANLAQTLPPVARWMPHGIAQPRSGRSVYSARYCLVRCILSVSAGRWSLFGFLHSQRPFPPASVLLRGDGSP
jgi:hypothetical protein